MKVDNIKPHKEADARRYAADRFTLRSYHVLFFVALVGVFFLNGVSIFQKLITIKNDVTYATMQGYNEFLGGLEDRDSFERARQYFLDAKSRVNELTQDTHLAENSTIVNDIQGLLEVSINLTEAGALTLEVQSVMEAYMDDINGEKDLAAIEEKIDQALAYMEDSIARFEDMDMGVLKAVLNQEQYGYLMELQDGVYTLNDLLAEIKQNVHPLSIFLGDRYPHRVLILLQNNNEIRPTGGFIGSLGFVDFNDGQIENITVRDVYDFDGIGVQREPHPEIALIAGNDWGIRDSNTSPHFPTSAKQAKQFLEEAKGPGVDSVIAIDLEVIRDIMHATGPLYIKEFDLPLNAGNFDLILSYFVESKRFGEKTPKKILQYFVTYLQDAMLAKLTPEQMIHIALRNIGEKHIQAYSDDPEVQEWFASLGMSGELPEIAPYHDYLSVVNVSIGGNKSDRFMHQALTHETFIGDDGKILNQLTVKRTHGWDDVVNRWIRRELRYVGIPYPDEDMIKILGRDTNKVLTRVYVPHGSELTASIGVAEEEVQVMYDEGLQYFLFPMSTDPGETKEVMIAYELPFELNFASNLNPIDDYRLFFEKQAGLDGVDFEKYMYYGPELVSYAHNPGFSEEGEGEVYRAIIRSDRILSVAVGDK